MQSSKDSPANARYKKILKFHATLLIYCSDFVPKCYKTSYFAWTEIYYSNIIFIHNLSSSKENENKQKLKICLHCILILYIRTKFSNIKKMDYTSHSTWNKPIAIRARTSHYTSVKCLTKNVVIENSCTRKS